jgi:hypothetical protein
LFSVFIFFWKKKPVRSLICCGGQGTRKESSSIMETARTKMQRLIPTVEQARGEVVGTIINQSIELYTFQNT